MAAGKVLAGARSDDREIGQGCPRCGLPLPARAAELAVSRAAGRRSRICSLCASLEAAAQLSGSALASVSSWPLTPAQLAEEFRVMIELARADPEGGPPAVRHAPHRVRWLPEKREVQALSRAGDRWSLLLVKVLATGPMREIEIHHELARLCAGPSGRSPSPGAVLQRLRALVGDGLATRTRFSELPPRVEFALTDAGRALVPVVKTIEAWGRQWPPEE